MSRTWGLVLVSAWCAACSSDGAPPSGATGAIGKSIPSQPAVDILFVIDNASDMSDKQTLLAESLPPLVAALDASPNGRPDLHVGVIDTTVDIGVAGWGPGCPSPDPADDGALQSTARVAGCAPPNGAFVSDVADGSGGRAVNYTGALADAVACIAQVGATGCAFDAPLEAMKRALDGSRPGNAGFLRDDASLVVIVLADEDDASVADPAIFSLPDAAVGGHTDFRAHPLFAWQCDQPISATAGGSYTNCQPRLGSYLQDPHAYAAFLSTLKGPDHPPIVAVIAGPAPGLVTNDEPPLTGAPLAVGSVTDGNGSAALVLEPSCTATIAGDPGIGWAGLRLASFAADFGARGRFYSICQSDDSAALADVANVLAASLDACLDAGVASTDTSAANPGLQLDCTVSDAADGAIPACAMQDASTPDPAGARPCWWSRPDPVACPAPSNGVEVQIERSAPAAPGTVVDVECAAAR